MKGRCSSLSFKISGLPEADQSHVEEQARALRVASVLRRSFECYRKKHDDAEARKSIGSHQYQFDVPQDT